MASGTTVVRGTLTQAVGSKAVGLRTRSAKPSPIDLSRAGGRQRRARWRRQIAGIRLQPVGALVLAVLVAVVAAFGYSMAMQFDCSMRSHEDWDEIGKSQYLWRNVLAFGPPGAVLYHVLVKREFDAIDAKRGHRLTVADDMRAVWRRARRLSE